MILNVHFQVRIARASMESIMWLRVLFLLVALLCLALFFLAYRHVRHSNETYGFIHFWGIAVGAFVWEDLMIFSLFFMIASSLVAVLRNLRLGLLLLVSFWMVRSAGETLYFFLQQFHRPEHPPHNIAEHFAPLHWLFGRISAQKCFIIMQIFWQTILVVAIASFALLLLRWDRVPIWLSL
jgi:hypothetical protein